MDDYPRRVKKQLRELASLAHESELRRELMQLAEKFEEWKEHKISTWELDHMIHEYHQGPARDLYSRYNNAPVGMLVAYAVVHRILKEEDVPEEVSPYIQNALQFYRADLGEEAYRGDDVQVS